MPQSKPMMWIKFMITMNLFMFMMVIKMLYSKSSKMINMYMNMNSPKHKLMKW